MDLLNALNELEELIEQSGKIPFTKKVRWKRTACWIF